MEAAYERQRQRNERYYSETTFNDLEVVDEVRQRFLAKADNVETGQGLYEIEDVHRVSTNDWTVRRFLKACNGNVKEAFKQLDKCMQWRKEYGVNLRKEKDCPIEFVEAGAIFPYHEDKEGRLVVYIRVKVNKRVPQLAPFFRQFLVSVIDRVDQVADAQGYCFVFDFTGVTLSNVDMDFLHFIITSLRNYYPQGLRRVIAFNLPWLLKGLWATVRMWLGPLQELIKFASGEEIKEFIAEENLPRYLGGKCTTNFIDAPKCCPPVADIAIEHGFTVKEVEKYMKIFKPHIEEAYKLVGRG